MTSARAPLTLSHGEGSFAYTDDGRKLVDLALGFGAAFLGHSHPAVVASLTSQAQRLWSTGRIATPAHARIHALVEALLPSGMRLGGLCSTGMEVAEFALRVAATHTARSEFVGFARSMHGKSAMTAGLCWTNAAVRPSSLHTVPFVADEGESEILSRLVSLLGTRQVAAVLVEPIQGSNGAREASLDFYQRVIALCREYGTLCVFDEILTGLYRTGPCFYAERLAELPDMILFAKSLGNGFPVSALALREGIAIRPEALPGSTFSGNPLALAAVEGTLTTMATLDMGARVAAIEASVRGALGSPGASGGRLRGRGALWCLELGRGVCIQDALVKIDAAGVLVSSAGNFIRLLPAATMDLHLLSQSCAKIAEACAAARS